MPPSGRHWPCSADLAVHSMICSRSFLVSSPAPSRFKCHLLCAISGPRASCFYLSGLRPRALYWSYYTAVFRACPLHTPLPPCPSPETDREGPCRPQSEGPCCPHPRLAQGLPYNGWNGGAHVHTGQAARRFPPRQHPGAGGQEDRQRASMVPTSGTQRGLRPAAQGAFSGSFAVNSNFT